MKNPPNVDPVAIEAADVLNRAADILVKEGWCMHLLRWQKPRTKMRDWCHRVGKYRAYHHFVGEPSKLSRLRGSY